MHFSLQEEIQEEVPVKINIVPGGRGGSIVQLGTEARLGR